MNIRHISHDPVEFQRIQLKMTQVDYSAKLGFRDVHEYHRNLQRFSMRLIEKVNKTFGVDLTADIIAYLCRENTRLKKEKKSHPGSKPAKGPTKNSSSDLESILDNIK